jgi:Zn ribbon nucleic-acid-binding protein
MKFREWITPRPKHHFGAQDRIECPKCGNGMYVMHRLIDATQNELQTLECLKCGHTQTRAVGDEGMPLKKGIS